MKKFNAYKIAQKRNDVIFSWINPMNVAEVANILLISKEDIKSKINQHMLNELLNKLDKILYRYHFRLPSERNFLATIDSLEQDLMFLIDHVNEIIALLTPARRQRLKKFAMKISHESLRDTTRQNKLNTIPISWA